MKVILTEDVYKHGVAGEIVKVADGFARNWLIPRGMARAATQRNLDELAELRTKANENRAAYTDKVNAAANQIDGVELVFGVKAGSNNKLYGSITSQMIKDALMEKTGLDINRRRISERTIRELGRYDVPVRMGDVSPVVHLVVLREEEVSAYLTGQSGPVASAEPAEAVAEPEAPVESAAETPAETPAE
ncbi:MAG TPA: 50S ribosomal protein L9 [Aggregatilineales bacterium]|nr:50S ribosomal protein L9 [Aggregatilineales bacterium]